MFFMVDISLLASPGDRDGFNGRRPPLQGGCLVCWPTAGRSIGVWPSRTIFRTFELSFRSSVDTHFSLTPGS